MFYCSLVITKRAFLRKDRQLKFRDVIAVVSVFLLVAFILGAISIHRSSRKSRANAVQEEMQAQKLAFDQREEARRHWKLVDVPVGENSPATKAISNSQVFLLCGRDREAYFVPDLKKSGDRLKVDAEYRQRIYFKFDDGKEESSMWDISETKDALFFPPKVYQRFSKAKKLTFRYGLEHWASVTEELDFSELPEALRQSPCPLRR